MALTQAPRGLRVLGNKVGAPFSGAINEYKVASGTAANIFTGDPVKLLTTGYVTVAAAGDQCRGVCAGFRYRDATGQPKVAAYWPTGTVTFGAEDAVMLVVDDPDVLLMAQFTTGAVLTSHIGNCFDVSMATAGNAATGQSGAAADFATAAATAATLRYHGPFTTPDNDMTGFGYGVFSWAEHDFKVSTGI